MIICTIHFYPVGISTRQDQKGSPPYQGKNPEYSSKNAAHVIIRLYPSTHCFLEESEDNIFPNSKPYFLCLGHKQSSIAQCQFHDLKKSNVTYLQRAIQKHKERQ
jgi:hypothetical protein